MNLSSRDYVEILLNEIYKKIGIDTPSNHEEILDFIVTDIKETADPKTWMSEHITIAFRRFLERAV